MREIQFRGEWDNMWDYAIPEDSHWQQFWALSKRETIGQFTGLRDKNGKEIYEGDILKGSQREATDEESGEWTIREGRPFEVKFEIDNPHSWIGFYFDCYEFGTLEVIGNVYESPELLK